MNNYINQAKHILREFIRKLIRLYNDLIYKFNLQSKKKLIDYASLAVIVLALPLFVLAVGKRVGLFSKAAGTNSTLSMLTTASATVGSTIDTPLFVNTDSAPIRGVDVVISFDTTSLKLADTSPMILTAQDAGVFKTFAPLDSNGNFNMATVINNANSTGRLEFSAIAFDNLTQTINPAFTGTTQIALFRFLALKAGNSVVSFVYTPGSAKDTTIVKDGSLPVNLVSTPSQLKSMTVTITSPTPIVTPTVMPTAVPTSTPPVPTAVGGSPVILPYSPSKDASVYAGSSTNYGSASSLEVDNSPVKRFWITFNPGVISGTLVSAKLRLYNIDSSSRGGDVYYTTQDNWNELTITGTNEPLIGSLITSVGPVSSGNWYEWDVTPVVNTTKGIFTFVFKSTGSDGADYNSREASSNKPQLVLTVLR